MNQRTQLALSIAVIGIAACAGLPLVLVHDPYLMRLVTMFSLMLVLGASWNIVGGFTGYSAARKERNAEHERRERNWKRQEQRAAHAKARADLEKARVEFLERRLIAFEEAGRLDRFLGRLTSASSGQERPPRFQVFVRWAEQRAQQLKHHCSAEGLQEGLAESSLFGPRPRPPSDYDYDED